MGTTSRRAGPVIDVREAGGVAVRVEGIRKSYGAGSAALDGVDLTIGGGELLALLGPSGSGKTTLLRVIAGLELAEDGRVYFDDADVTDVPVQDRQIGFVFQHYALFKHLTVADNIAYGLRARRRGHPGRAAIRSRVADLLALMQLENLGARYPAQLSGGERQRVALARALATSPRVLLLDEPFGALDARVRKDLRGWLRDIHRETGQTTVFVTHDQDEALELADRVAILNRGRLEQVGPPDLVHDQPASVFVADFIGNRQRLPVTLRQGRVWLGSRPLSIPDAGAREGDAVLFVRPDELSLGAGGELAATVSDIRGVGTARKAVLRLLDAPGNLEVELRGPAPQVGDHVEVTIGGGVLFQGD